MTRNRRASVLLVDDEPDNLVALTAVLEPLGRELVQATSGEQALALLLKREFAVILLDVRMPGLDGFETAALIKQREKTRHIPIIFVTAVSKDTEHVFRGYSEGAVDYLLKPYDPAVLRSKVSVFVELYEQKSELEESEARFRTAFANAPSGMAAVAQMVRNLQSVSDTALTHLALDDLLPELLDRIAEILRADAVSVLLADPESDGLLLRASRGVAAVEEPHRVPVGRGTFAGRVAKERRPIVVEDGEGDGGLRSLIGVPLLAEGEVSGVVIAGSLTPNRFDDNDAALLALVADRAALAIGNAGLFEREHKIVETLQRSLLPARLPNLPGMSLAAHYSPGGADVGGDWYDAIELSGGGVGLAMGDVVGHGIEAAALMGELRNALRAYALEGGSPAAVLSRLDHLVSQMEGDQMATLVYAVIDPDWTRVRFAGAGHPPPLLLRPDGDAEFLWDGRSTPLGVGGA